MTNDLNERLNKFAAEEKARREHQMQRFSGVWVTVDGGTYGQRRWLASHIGESLHQQGMQVQERQGLDARRVSMSQQPRGNPSQLDALGPIDGQSLSQLPVVFVVPEHNRQPMPGSSTVYSGRAECMSDVEEVLQKLLQSRRLQLIGTTYEVGYLHPDSPSGEVMVEFRFQQPVPREVIDQVIASVDDTHVLYQTLEPIPLMNNPCERDRQR